MLDMDRLRHGGSAGGLARSLGREKSPHRSHGSSKVLMPDLRPRGGGVAGDPLLPLDGARGGGNVQLRKRASALKVEADGKVKIPTQHNVESSSKKVGGTPVKILMEKEMQNHVESKQHSTSVIAKLMGLDPLPAQQPCNMQKKESVMCSHKGSSEGFPGHISCEERKQEFKDIFEVLETKALEKPKSLSSRRRSKEMANIRQKFMDAKCFPTDDKLQSSEGSSELSEVLDSSRDLHVKFLQEPTSLFEKYLRDLHSVPATPEANHITILKSSNVLKHKNSEMCEKSKRTERNTPVRWNAMHKPESDIFIPSVKEHTTYSSKLSKPKLGGSIDVNSLPTRIVVLKPSLEKDQKSAQIQGTSENFQSSNIDYRRRREFRRSGSLGILSDVRERQELPNDAELPHRMKGSREIANEITKHMRHTVHGDYVSSYGPRHGTFPGHGNLHKIPVASARTSSEAVMQTSGHVDGWYKNCSSSYSTETYASREAKKHLSERWMMTHKFREVEFAGDGLSTLGEMLALSDKEMPDMHSSSASCQERSPVRLCGKEISTRWISPSCISSKDGWKNGCSSRLPRSKSLPASSTIYGSANSADTCGTNHIDNSLLKDVLNVGSRKVSVEKLINQRPVFPYKNVKNCSSTSQPSSGDEEENKFPVREILVDQNELVCDLDSENSPVEKFAHSESCSISDTTYVVDPMPVACDVGPQLPCLIAKQQLLQSPGSSEHVADECSPANCEKDIVAKEALHYQPESGSTLPHTHVTGQTCPVADKEVEQPSPISVLEPSDENECSPESFERVSADLQELRMQLELLKLESRDTNVDRIVTGNEDAGGEIIDVPLAGIPLTSGDKEEREFSYLLNVLRDSGFHNADHGALFDAFYSTEYPVCPDAFEKLEKMYGGLIWSRAERKLLFDLVNAALADIVALNNDLYPWAKPKRGRLIGCRKNLAGEVWESLVRQRTVVTSDASGKFIDDIRWLDMADDTESIGREIERMLKDDLLEELVSEIVCVN